MIETYFFKAYYAYLLGDKPTTETYFSFLREEFKKSGNSESLKPHQLRELKYIKESLTTGKLPSTFWLTDSTISTEEKNKTIEIESDVVKKIHLDGFKELRKLVNSNDKFYLYNLEHPCEEYGEIDMVYMDDRIAYPVEVKRGIGKHDLIGQVMKYTLALKLKLHYHFYEEVKPVTICSGYKDYVVQELKKLGVLTLVYNTVKEKLTLQAV